MRKFLGSLLIGIGLLFATLSGLCSFVFPGSYDGKFDPRNLGVLVVVGGIPFAFGFACVVGGNALFRWANTRP